ncbi:MAG: histidine phosphatase family protein [Pseudomonas sp.]
MDLYVVRHGETPANAEQRYIGSLDPALNARGREQAQALAAQLPHNLDVVVVSPRLRAQETASILNQTVQLPSEVLEAFRERDVGVFEGLTKAEARERYPELWAQNITRRWGLAPTGGESVADVVQRVRGGLVDLQTRYPGKNILLVAHGFIAKTIRAIALRDFSDFYEWQLANGGLLLLENVDAHDRDEFGQLRPEGWGYADFVANR